MAPKKPVKKAVNAQVPRKRKSQSKIWLAIVIFAVVVISVAVYATYAAQHPASNFPPTKVLLQTTAGDITIDLRTDKPITSANFANLVREGKYDNTTFHRVVKGFMIQGGQVIGENSLPKINDEIGTDNRNTQYTIAMANAGPNTATSEFFINTVDNSGVNRYATFDTSYTVFGTVTSGQDVVRTIENGATMPSPYIPGENSIPVAPVTIIHATIVP